MFAVPDALAAFYLICFLIGLVFILFSAFIGLSQDIGHLPGLHHGPGVGVGHGVGGVGHGVGDVGHGVGDIGHGLDGAAMGHGDAGAVGSTGGDAGHADGRSPSGAGASPLNLMTVMAFLTWFGGAGYLLHVVYGALLPLSLLGGLLSGLLAGWLVYLLLVKVLLPNTVTRDARENQVVGNLGRVTIGIAEGALGEIVYTMDGSRHSDGARSADGLPIPRGTEVVIVRFEKGVAYVQPWRRFLNEASERTREER